MTQIDIVGAVDLNEVRRQFLHHIFRVRKLHPELYGTASEAESYAVICRFHINKIRDRINYLLTVFFEHDLLIYFEPLLKICQSLAELELIYRLA